MKPEQLQPRIWKPEKPNSINVSISCRARVCYIHIYIYIYLFIYLHTHTYTYTYKRLPNIGAPSRFLDQLLSKQQRTCYSSLTGRKLSFRTAQDDFFENADTKQETRMNDTSFGLDESSPLPRFSLEICRGTVLMRISLPVTGYAEVLK